MGAVYLPPVAGQIWPASLMRCMVFFTVSTLAPVMSATAVGPSGFALSRKVFRMDARVSPRLTSSAGRSFFSQCPVF